MKPDPAIAAIREVRHRISEAANHDPQKLVERYRRLQQKHRDRVIFRTATRDQMQSDTTPSTDRADIGSRA